MQKIETNSDCKLITYVFSSSVIYNLLLTLYVELKVHADLKISLYVRVHRNTIP